MSGHYETPDTRLIDAMKAIVDAPQIDFWKEVRGEERPVAEMDATLTFNGHEIPLSLTVYGKHQPRFAGSRETPEEPEFVEIDRVILSSRDGKADIYDALSWADLQTISDAILEG